MEDNDHLMVVVLHEGRAFCPRVLENTGGVRKDGAASFTIDGWKGKRCICIVSLFRLMRSSYL